MFQRLRDIYFLRFRRLRKRYFKGKRVIVVGPAESVHDDLREFSLDDFDVVVKLNNALTVPLTDRDGTPTLRCDVLFHSMSLDVPEIRRRDAGEANVKFVVHRTPDRKFLTATRSAIRHFKDQSIAASVRVIEPKRYKELRAQLGKFSPSTGMVSLDYFLGCNTKHLAIVGFTFFCTKYASGYRDATSQEDIFAKVTAAGHHNPERERTVVRSHIEAEIKKGRSIALGPSVAAYLGGITAGLSSWLVGALDTTCWITCIVAG